MSIINSLIFANNIFETSDFDNDGIPDDLGFKIKLITIYTTLESHDKHFKLEKSDPIEATEYLKLFSNYTMLPKDICVNILLTSQIFKRKHISVSHVLPTSNMKSGLSLKKRGGALCAKSAVNRMIVTNKIENNYYVPVFITQLALIHELGHIFGATHDSGACNGFVMSPQFQYFANVTSYKFSNCSTPHILQHLDECGFCLKKWKTKSHCGNGKIPIL